MKHDSFPYNETEWNKIVDDAFAPDAQPHVFSERYTSRKQEFRRQMEESHMKQHKFRMKKSLTAAVAVAAAIVVIPTAVYASTQIRGYFQNGGGEYQQEMVIPKSDSVSDQIMALQVGWMPDGMATDTNSGKYRDPNGRSITMLFYKIDNTDDALTHTVNYSVSQETLTCGSNTVLYAVTDTTGVSGKDVFDKDVWVAFPDSNYAVQLYATTGVTKEEIEKIAENLSLTPSDKETAELWSGEPQEEATGGTDEVYKVDDYTIQQIGDTIRSDFYDDDDKYSRVTVKLDSVSVQDNFDGLPAVDEIGNPVDYSQYLNADGTVKDDVRTWYSRGDGVNTLDEKVKEETVPQRVLVMHLSYTNESSITQEICVCPNLLQKNGDRLDYGAVACEPTDETMYCNGTLDDLKYGEFFLFTTDRDHSKNNITNVAPGETVEATVAFLMDADELQDLYADILGSGQKTIVFLGDLQ